MKIASVVVTYNRKELLAENIRMQLLQSKNIDMIIIIDNHSSDGTRSFLEINNLLTNRIKYCYLDENIGGAGGFSYGIELAYKLGYDYIWLMDDDGKPYDEKTFENILSYAISFHRKNRKIMLNSLVIDGEDKLSFTLLDKKHVSEILQYVDDGVINGAISPFNGTLISRELVEKIGIPNKDFFIKGDEAEYTMRATDAGAKIATVTSSLYKHPSLEMGEINILFKRIKYNFIEAPWKEYYRSRNYTYMFTRKKKRIKAFMLFVLRICIAKKYRASKETIEMIKRGYKDGKNGKLGKRILP